MRSWRHWAVAAISIPAQSCWNPPCPSQQCPVESGNYADLQAIKTHCYVHQKFWWLPVPCCMVHTMLVVWINCNHERLTCWSTVLTYAVWFCYSLVGIRNSNVLMCKQISPTPSHCHNHGWLHTVMLLEPVSDSFISLRQKQPEFNST